MNKKQIEVEKAKLADEKKVLDALKKQYMQAADDVAKKISFHTGKIDALLSDWDNLDEVEKSILQSQIYQRKYQQSLQKQICEIIDNMNDKQYQTVEAYLKGCYETGFIGSLYDIHGQGIPIITPINQKAMVKAVTLDSKVSKKLYGSYVDELKKRIQAEVSRGVATNTQYSVIARNLNMQAGIGFNKAMRIARTEGGKIRNSAAYNAALEAKEKGADIVLQWDAALDKRTRDSHRRVDGEIVELGERFSNGLLFPCDPAGAAGEVINCRCAALQRAKWALDDDELETLKERAAYYGLDKTNNFEDFKSKYLKAVEAVSAPKPAKTFTPAKTVEEAEEYAKQFVKEKTWSGNGNVSYKGLSLESANKFNETLLNLYEQNDIHLLNNIQPMNFRQTIWKGSETTPMAYRSAGDGDLFFNPKIMKNAKSLDAYMEEGRKAFKTCAENIDKFKGTDRELIETYLKAGSSLVAETTDDAMKTIIEHEMGHHIQHSIIYNSEEMAKIVADGFEKYGVKISGYATKTKGEYIAESYAAFCNGKAELIDPKLKDIFENIRKTGRN